MKKFILFILFIYSHLDGKETKRIFQERVVNVYFSMPEGIQYKNISLTSCDHAVLFEAVDKLGERDNYEVNHLFAQLFCVVKNSSGLFEVLHANIGWDQKLKRLSLQKHAPLVNFVSRNYNDQEEASYKEKRFYYLNASNSSFLQIFHSEHLLLQYLKERSNFFTEFLLDIEKGTEIVKIGLILYSSNDSCDQCQGALVQFFESNSSFTEKIKAEIEKAGYTFAKDAFWRLFIFSGIPYKKSSYIVENENSREAFLYDKEKRKFFYRNAPTCELIFPCLPYSEEGQNSRLLIYSHIRDYCH